MRIKKIAERRTIWGGGRRRRKSAARWTRATARRRNGPRRSTTSLGDLRGRAAAPHGGPSRGSLIQVRARALGPPRGALRGLRDGSHAVVASMASGAALRSPTAASQRKARGEPSDPRGAATPPRAASTASGSSPTPLTRRWRQGRPRDRPRPRRDRPSSRTYVASIGPANDPGIGSKIKKKPPSAVILGNESPRWRQGAAEPRNAEIRRGLASHFSRQRRKAARRRRGPEPVRGLRVPAAGLVGWADARGRRQSRAR